MGIIKINARNFKIHKDLQINPNGQSFFVVGDSGEGKSTVLEIIRIAFMIDKMPAQPLTEGEEDGFIQVVVDDHGMQYTIERKFSKRGKSDRFTIYDNNGGKYSSLESLLEKILGPAFSNKFFDWQEYFYKTKSSKERFDYFIKAFGRKEINNNIQRIKDLTKERASVGGQKTLQWNHFTENGGTQDEKILETEYAYYLKERSFDTALSTKQAFLNANLIDLEELTIEKEIVDGITHRKNVIKADISDKKNEISEIDKKIKYLLEEKGRISDDIKIMQEQVKSLDKNSEKKSKKFEEQINLAIQKNEETLKQAEESYQENIKSIADFNSKRAVFFSNIKSLGEFTRLNKEWHKLDRQIDILKRVNKRIFKNNLPIPELSVGFDDKENEVILYNGREFALGNISTGESIQITAKIQRSLNPDGTSFIVIPNAQDLGSKIDDVMEYCKEFNIQAIVEMTKRDEKFKVVITDDARSI